MGTEMNFGRWLAVALACSGVACGGASPRPAPQGAPDEPAPAPSEQPASEPATTAEAEPAATDADDAPDPIEELASLGADLAERAPEGGGSVRAKRTPPATDPPPKNAVRGKVVGIAQGSFPLVALKVQVLSASGEGTTKDLARNRVIVVLPTYAIWEGAIDLRDPLTIRNAMAYYLVYGDRVTLQLASREGTAWRATSIVRE